LSERKLSSMQLPDTDIENRRGLNECERRTDRLGELTRKRQIHPGQSDFGIAIIRHHLKHGILR
jgi:hypothetical protein